MPPRYAYGVSRIRIWDTALPCPGVALRLHTVIDCTPSAARMSPVTIDFLKKLLPSPQQRRGAAAATNRVVTGRFTCDAGDFVLINQIRRVELMVAAAGLPPACATSVNAFLQLSAATAANSFYKAVAVTVEAGDPDSIFASGGDLPEDEGEPARAACRPAACAPSATRSTWSAAPRRPP
ncbi:unnamed protein product [Urochloa humidicola]